MLIVVALAAAMLRRRPQQTAAVCQETVTIAPNQDNLVNSYEYQDCTALRTLVFDNSIDFIGAYAFSGCTALSSITWPSSLKTIKDYAFQGCSSLTSLTLPSNVQEIEAGAFKLATSLTSVVFPSSLSSCHGLVFQGAPSVVMSIANDGGVANFTVYDSGRMLLTKDFETVVLVTESVTILDIPSQTKILERYSCSDLSIGPAVTLPDGVETLKSDCFNSCRYLKTVVFGKGVTYIDGLAFRGSGVEKYIVDADNQNFASQDGVVFDKSFTTLLFYPVNKAESVVHLPANLRSITSLALADTQVASFVLEGNEFLELDSTHRVVFNKGKTTLICAAPKMTGSYTIPATVTSLGDGAFATCSLSSVQSNGVIRSIGESCFYLCLITSFDLTGVVSLGTYAFHGSYLSFVTVVGTISAVPVQCFGYSGLEEVKIAMGVKRLETGCFSACRSLEKVEFAESITIIGPMAFMDTKIESLKLPTTKLEMICSNAFENSAISGTIRIPYCVKIVKTEAFSTCWNADNAVIENCETIIEENVFRGIYDRVKPHCIATVRFSAWFNDATAAPLRARKLLFLIAVVAQNERVRMLR